jgi:hypothetical protein
MAWSSKEALLEEFLPRFHDRQLCQKSLEKYIREARVLDDQRARNWLEKDLARDKELASIADPEDYALGPSRYDLNGCYHCDGRGFVRLDVDVHHVDFGKAKPCPACSTRPGSPATHCEKCAAFSASLSRETAQISERNRCTKCGRFEDEAAGEKCRNAKWHLPNWRGIPKPEPGMPRDYVAELARQMRIE